MLGVLLAFGEPGRISEQEARFTRTVRRPSVSHESLELELPSEGLHALGADDQNSNRSIELSVWAGSQLLGFGIDD